MSKKIEEIDLKETFKSFIKPEEGNKTQEQEIIDFKLKKDIKKLEKKILDEAEKEKKEKEEEEEEELKKIKEVLLQSLKKEIPEIEKRYASEKPSLHDKNKGKESFRTQELGKDIEKQLEKEDEKEHELEERE